MAVDFTVGPSAALRRYIKAGGNENIILHETLSTIGGPTMYALRCNECGYTAQWTYNIQEQYGIELDIVNGFCNSHKHEIPQLSQPKAGNVPVLTASGIEYIEKPAYVITASEGDSFNLLGDIQTNIGGVEFSSKTVTAVSSTALKLIARRSNFNVDLQCKPGFKPSYRGVCSQCGKESVMTREEVFALDKGEVGPKFDSFLTEHKHDGSDRELPNGRKFRHASQ